MIQTIHKMEELDPTLLQNIAKFLSLSRKKYRTLVLGELFCSFEPVCRKTKEAVNEVFQRMVSDF